MPQMPVLPLTPRLASLSRHTSPLIVPRVLLFAVRIAGATTAPRAQGRHTATVKPSVTRIVTTNADSGPGSLRDAVAAASPGDLITFQNGLGPIVLTTGPITIATSLTINTSAAPTQTVSGNNASRVFAINSGVQVALNNLIVRDGNDTNFTNFGGGGILNNGGTLAISGSALISNTTTNFGGGLENFGTATLTDTLVLSNTSSRIGGGIDNDLFSPNATLHMSGSTLAGNSARFDGGLSNGGTATLTNTLVLSNTSSRSGGGGITNGGTLSVSGSTVAGNSAEFDGGLANGGTATLTNTLVLSNTGSGITNGGTLSVSGSTVAGNRAIQGGGLANGGTATLTNTLVLSNTSNFDGPGGGIYNSSGTLSVSGSTVAGNSAASYDGGGLDNRGTATLTNTLVLSNTSSGFGGGIDNGAFSPNATLSVSGSTVAGNSATLEGGSGSGGGLDNEGGTATLTNVAVLSNTSNFDGGGIDNKTGATLVLTGSDVLTNTTVTGTTAGSGGGLNNNGTAVLANDTIAGNSTGNSTQAGGGNGGGIATTGVLSATNVTINANQTGAFGSGGGVALIAGTAILTNTIVSGDRQAAGAIGPTTDISGSVRSGGHNLILVDPRSAGYVASTGDIIGQDPQLLPLANNGGPTLTEALGSGSLARGNADPAACAAPPVNGVDQRGMPRNPAYCSIGAYDEGGMALPPGTETAIAETQTAVSGTQTAMASQTAGAGATATNTAAPATATATNTAAPATATATNTAAPATATATNTAAPATATGTATTAPASSATTTATNTSVSATTPPASATSTATATPSTTATASPSTTNMPINTATNTPTNTPTTTPTNTSTNTPTNTPMNTPTTTPAPSTNTSTNTPTTTPVPPTNTSTSTPTNTSTSAPTSTPTNTGTAVPPTSTATPTFMPLPTIIPLTPAPTDTAAPTSEPLPPIVTRSYLAGGVNAPGQPSFVSIVNPSAARARVRLTFYFPDGATHGSFFTVARDTQRTIPVSSLIGRTGSFGLAVASDRGIVAGLVLARNGRDDDTLVGSASLSRTWYLAEGYTALTFHETVALLNPDPDHAARVSLLLLPAGGRGRRETVTVSVRAHSEQVVDINALAPGRPLSIVTTSNRPIVVERTLIFSSDAAGAGYGLTTRLGEAHPAQTWLFAEGSTSNRFQTFLTVLNTSQDTAHVTAAFYDVRGRLLARQTLAVTGLRRATLRLNDFLNASGIASVVTSDRPIVVERPEYFGSPNAPHIAGSDVFGRTRTSPFWIFPSGDTAGKSEFLLLFNPTRRNVPVRITVYESNGRAASSTVTLAPRERGTVEVGRRFPGATSQRGEVVRTLDGQGIVVEQTVFAPDHGALRSTQGLLT